MLIQDLEFVFDREQRLKVIKKVFCCSCYSWHGENMIKNGTKKVREQNLLQIKQKVFANKICFKLTKYVTKGTKKIRERVSCFIFHMKCSVSED